MEVDKLYILETGIKTWDDQFPPKTHICNFTNIYDSTLSLHLQKIALSTGLFLEWDETWSIVGMSWYNFFAAISWLIYQKYDLVCRQYKIKQAYYSDTKYKKKLERWKFYQSWQRHTDVSCIWQISINLFL